MENNKITLNKMSKEIQYLCEKDPIFLKLVYLIGEVSLELRNNRFKSLVKTIIGQQLSVKTASTITNRLLNILEDNITIPSLMRLSDEELRGVGISIQKISYLRDLCIKIYTGEVNLETLDTLDDHSVIEHLMRIKGIGEWSSEMFLIFSLGRKNVLSLKDVGLQRAYGWLYKSQGYKNFKESFIESGNKWKPYCSYASLYLWESVNLGYVNKYPDVDQAIISMGTKYYERKD